MAPKLDAAEIKTYVEAITRIADLMSLASMIPVLFECRFGLRVGRLRRETEERKEARREAARQKQQQHQQQQTQKQLREEKEKQQPSEQEEAAANEWPVLPLGAISVLLFAAAEVVSCPGMFVPAVKAVGKSKTKAATTPEGPLGVLLEATRSAVKTLQADAAKEKQSEKGFVRSMEKTLMAAVEALTQREAFDAAHIFVMLVALIAILISLLGHYALPSLKMMYRQGRLPLRRGVLALVPVLLFGVLQWQSMRKVWRALEAEKFLPSLPRPLRVAAVILAAAPGAGQAPELPAFGILQAGSLAAMISAEIASGRLASYLAQLANGSLVETMVDSRAMTFFIPTVLAIVWVAFVHLRKSPFHLLLAALASVLSSPLLLITGWSKVAAMGGVVKDASTALVKALSVAYLITGFSFLMAGGTLTIMSLMGVGNLLIRIHGQEIFSGLIY